MSRKWESLEIDQQAQAKDKRLDTYWNTGVFQKTVNGITVGYFVGWRYHWEKAKARNIRQGLFFDTPGDAIAFRDSLEKRCDMVATDIQIA